MKFTIRAMKTSPSAPTLGFFGVELRVPWLEAKGNLLSRLKPATLKKILASSRLRAVLVATALSAALLPRIASAQTPAFYWATNAWGARSDVGYTVAVDSSNNVYYAGTFSSPVAKFGSLSVTNLNTNSPTDNLFIAKCDNSGNALWAVNIGKGRPEFHGLATDRFNNLFAVGRFEGNATFGAITLTNDGSHGAFIVKYDATGTALWATNIGGPYPYSEGTVFRGITVDQSNNACVVGYFGASNVTFGSFTLTNQNTNGPSFIEDAFVAKYRSDGTVLWARSAGGLGGSGNFGYGVATDASNNVFIVGELGSITMTIGSTTLTNLGGSYGDDVMILKYDSNGNLLWATNAGGDSYDGASAVCVDREGNICLTGYFYSPIVRFGDFVLTRHGTSDDRFVAKYDGSGNALWATNFVGDNGIYVYDIAMDRVDNLYLAGHFRTNRSFGHITLTPRGAADAFVLKYGPSGHAVWGMTAGASGNSAEAKGIAIDNLNGIYVTGAFAATAEFGNTTLTSSGLGDAFLAKIVNIYNVSVNTPGGGTVVVNPPTGPYAENSVVTFTAVPAAGWSFLGWFGDVSGSSPTTNLTVNWNKCVEALFGTPVSTSAAGGGTVSITPATTLYPYGSVVHFTATPQPARYFSIWGGSASGNMNPFYFTVTDPIPAISSLFEPLPDNQVSLNGCIRRRWIGHCQSTGQFLPRRATGDAHRRAGSGTDLPWLERRREWHG